MGTTLTPQQMNTLGTYAHRGAARVVPLGLADAIGPVVVHFKDEQLLIDPDGRVMDEERIG